MNDGAKHVTVINRMIMDVMDVMDVKEKAVPEKADQHGTRQMRVLAAEDNRNQPVGI